MSEVEILITMDENGGSETGSQAGQGPMSGFLMPDKDAKPLVKGVFPIVAPSPDHVWVEISLKVSVATTIH